MKTPVKILALLLMAPLMMGNEGCEQQTEEPVPIPTGRRLRQQVEVSKIQAPRLNFPGAENFDFEFVLNSQIYDVLNSDDRFVVAYSSSDLSAPAMLSERDRLALAPPPGFRASAVRALAETDPYGSDVCMARVPVMMIGGQVRSFEVTSGLGFWFGFTPQGKGDGSMGGSTSINIQSGQMEVGMVAYHPLSRMLYGTGIATPKHTKIDINLTINFGEFSLGPKYFYQSRLAGVTMKGLTESLRLLGNDLEAKALKENRSAWESRVIKDYDTHITIRAGRRHGIVLGDEFAVYNLDHAWEDDTLPCRSPYLGSVRNTNEPIAILKATSDRDLGDEFSRLEVIEHDANGSRARPGAQVVIRKLFEEQPKEAAPPVEVMPPPAPAPAPVSDSQDTWEEDPWPSAGGD